MNDQIQIRPAVTEDINTLVGLLGQLFGVERSFTFDADAHRRGLEALLDNPGLSWIWVAHDGNQVTGMCTAQRQVSTALGGPVLHIEDVVIDSRHRGKGIGTALLSHVEDWARAQGYVRLQLVAEESNPLALAFYRSQDWEKTDMIWHRKHISAGEPSTNQGGG